MANKQKQETYTKPELLQWGEIALLQPIYQDNGKNGCIVYYCDGSYDKVRNSCATVRARMAKMYSVNIKEAEKAARAYKEYNRRRAVSVQLHEHCTLVPVVCRKAQRRNSGTLGYLVLERLYECTPAENGRTLLKFSETHKGVEIQQHFDTVQKQLLLAHQLVRCYERDKERKLQELQNHTGPKPHIGHNW